MIKVSLIHPVLNSHEVVRRQLLHYRKAGISDDVEIIIMDDGSDPPLEFEPEGLPLTIHPTNDTRPFTSSIARNTAAREIARGDYLLMADIDYIIPQETIEYCCAFEGDKIQFRREFGILDENGDFSQDIDVLLKYGLLPRRIKERGVAIPPHPNVYLMRRQLFLDIGGYNERLVVRRQYPQGEDNGFKKAWHRWQQEHGVITHHERPMVYMFPVGQFCGDVDYNPFDLFDTTLSKKTPANVFYQRQLRREENP